MTLVALAILVLAAVILFREEIRFMIGAVLLAGLATWVWYEIRTGWPIWLIIGLLAAVVTVFGGQRELARRQAVRSQGRTQFDMELAQLNDQWDHGELTDEQYWQARATLMARYGITIRPN